MDAARVAVVDLEKRLPPGRLHRPLTADVVSDGAESTPGGQVCVTSGPERHTGRSGGGGHPRKPGCL
jgi:hypothetical protein